MYKTINMEPRELSRKWPAIKRKMIEYHPNAKIEEVNYEEGKEEHLINSLMEKLRMNRDEVNNTLNLMC